MSYIVNYSYSPKVRNGPFPLVQQDQNGHRWVYDSRDGTFKNIDIGTILTVVGPLVVNYVVPFIKDLISKQKPLTTLVPVPVPVTHSCWPLLSVWSTPCTSVSTSYSVHRVLCDSPFC